MKNIIELNKDDILIEDLGNCSVTVDEPVRSNHMVIILCRNGEATVELNYSTYVVRKDSFFVVSPFDIITHKNTSEDFECTILALPSLTLSTLFADIDITRYEYIKRSPLVYLNEEYRIVISQSFELMKSIRRLVPAEKFNEIAEKQVVSLFFIQHHYFTENMGHKSDFREYMPRKKELFRKFINSLISSHSLSREVLYYANELGVSCGYLNEVCNEVSNHSVKEIIDSTVATRLKYELSCTTKSIQELADEYNFPSQSYFCRYYKRLTGMTPSDFRKKRAGR